MTKRKAAFRDEYQNEYQRECAAEYKVALKLIGIGYRALAKELHPDTPHGDRDAMIRLNRVCDKLKHSI
jgi:hypothetical protein